MLALDTSTPACSVALVDLSAPAGQPGVARVLRASQVVDARRHGELLSPLMRDVLAGAGVKAADLGGVVVGLGPGPFTSLRVGIVTGAAFAAALGLPCHGVCSLDGIGGATSGRVGVVTDARRRELFWAAYTDGRRTTGPAVDAPARVGELLSAAGATAVTGPGLALYPDAFAGFATAAGPAPAPADAAEQAGWRARVVPAPAAPPAYPDPAVLAALAAPDLLAGRAPGPLTAIYLRRPDAAEPHPPKAVTA